MNNDVVQEILSHLPVRSLLRFKTVCKFWGDVIDSPRFRKVHSTNKDTDEKVCLQYVLRGDSLSIMLLDNRNRKPLKSHHFPSFNTKFVTMCGPVKGLLCISPFECMQSMAIAMCNPFLGQSKILPLSPSSHSQCDVDQYCGIGFDEDYKVVHMVFCYRHGCLEANLYSKRTDSWRELDIDKEFLIICSIKSLCKNGSYAHWIALKWCDLLGKHKRVILSFDMKNEVFRTITLPHEFVATGVEILAKDEYSFVLFDSYTRGMINVYESSGEGNELVWTHVVNVEVEFPIRSDDCVAFKNRDTVVLKRFFPNYQWVFYDYRARKVIARLTLPAGSSIIEYEGSLVSP